MSPSKKEELVPVGSKFTTSAVGLTMTARPSWAEWECALSTVAGISRSCQWWLGDLLNLGHSTFGEKYTQAVDELGYDAGYLRNVAYVCGRVQLSLRSDKLTFSHCALVAPLEPEEQKKWIALAIKNAWTVQQMRNAMNGKDEEDDDVDPVETVEKIVSIVKRIPFEDRHEIIADVIDALHDLDRVKA